MPMSPLHVECHSVNGSLVIYLNGDADLAGCQILEAELTRCSAQHPKLAVFDLTKLSFLSSLAMGCLIAFRRGVAERGGKVHVASPQPQVLEALVRARLRDLLPIYPNLQEALSTPL